MAHSKFSQKINYLIRSAWKNFTGFGFCCPSCACRSGKIVDRKYLFTALRRCDNCKLLFRTPTTSEAESEAFYQKAYTEGFTTDMPDDESLDSYLRKGFSGTEKDYGIYLSILAVLGVQKGARMLDFGCSWGYGSWQFKKYGYVVESFEVSALRAKFATEKLDLIVHTDPSEINGMFDLFFSAHVLEHVPSVSKILKWAEDHLVPGGLFVAFTPNGTHAFREKSPKDWSKLWGMVHPNFLDDAYYRTRFMSQKYLLMSNPYDLNRISNFMSNNSDCFGETSLDGDELLVVVKK